MEYFIRNGKLCQNGNTEEVRFLEGIIKSFEEGDSLLSLTLSVADSQDDVILSVFRQSIYAQQLLGIGSQIGQRIHLEISNNKLEWHRMESTKKEIAEKITIILKDYRDGEEQYKVTKEGILKWSEQFGEDGEFMLKEYYHLLAPDEDASKGIYFSKKRVENWLKRRIQYYYNLLKEKNDNNNISWEDFCNSVCLKSWEDFCNSVCFLKLQKEGKSQSDLLQLVEKILENENVPKEIIAKLSEENDHTKKIFVYFDDILVTGSTAYMEIYKLTENTQINLYVDVLCAHLSGLAYLGRKLANKLTAIKVNTYIEDYFKEGCSYTEDAFKRIQEILDPDYFSIINKDNQWISISPVDNENFVEINDKKSEKYKNDLFDCLCYRDLFEKKYPKDIVTAKFSPSLFTSEYNAIKFYIILLDKGLDLTNNCKKANQMLRPLGNARTWDNCLGKGTMHFTYRNIPNNSPIALWWSLGWEPLIKRYYANKDNNYEANQGNNEDNRDGQFNNLQDVISALGNLQPEKGFNFYNGQPKLAIIIAGGSATGKTAIANKYFNDFERLSADDLGDIDKETVSVNSIIKLHNKYVQSKKENPNVEPEFTESWEFDFAKNIIETGLPESMKYRDIQNVPLNFKSDEFSPGFLSSVLSKGVHTYEMQESILPEWNKDKFVKGDKFTAKDYYFHKKIDECAGNRNVIIDITGTERDIKHYSQYLKTKNYNVALIWVISPLGQAQIRNWTREREMKPSAVAAGHENSKHLRWDICIVNGDDDRCLKEVDYLSIAFNLEENKEEMPEPFVFNFSRNKDNPFRPFVEKNDNILNIIDYLLAPQDEKQLNDYALDAWAYFTRMRIDARNDMSQYRDNPMKYPDAFAVSGHVIKIKSWKYEFKDSISRNNVPIYIKLYDGKLSFCGPYEEFELSINKWLDRQNANGR